MLGKPKNGLKYGFLSNSRGHINNFCQIMYFIKKRLFRKRVALNMLTKLTQKREGGFGKC